MPTYNAPAIITITVGALVHQSPSLFLGQRRHKMGHLNCPPRKRFLRIVSASIFVVILGILYGHHLPNIPPTVKEHVSQYASALYFDHLSNHSQPQPFLEGEESPELPSEPIHLFTSVSSGRPAAIATAPVHGCPAVPNAADFLVSMKTGATELFAKLPLQLLTTLRCMPNCKCQKSQCRCQT